MGIHNWNDIKRSKNDPAQAARVRQRVEAELLEMSLAELRRALEITQVELATAAEMAQSQVSALENRDDHLVSTLRRCVRALGKKSAEHLRSVGTPIVKASPDGAESDEVASIRAPRRAESSGSDGCREDWLR